MKFIIDRFEGNFAVCEDENGKMYNIPKEKLPDDCIEGNCIKEENNAFFVDVAETQNREEMIKKLFESLRKKD